MSARAHPARDPGGRGGLVRDREDREQTRAVKPFLKWAGGKARHVPVIQRLLGKRQFRTYAEPFLGGGAVFFALAAEGRFERALLSDLNQELILCYRAVRDDPSDVLEYLNVFAARWSEGQYRKVRAYEEAHLAPAAARTIYLNKAGFNGLYRVNKAGVFNVPWGKKEKAPDWNRENLMECSSALNTFVMISACDFVDALHQVTLGKRDLVYLDPPYVPRSKSSDFTSYTAGGFEAAAQERVAVVFERLAKAKVTVLLSQSDVPWVRERFSGFHQEKLSVRRNISASGAGRSPVGEVIILANV